MEQVKLFLRMPGHRELLDEVIREDAEEEWNTSLQEPVKNDFQMKEWYSRFEERKTSFTAEPSEPLRLVKKRPAYLKYAAIWVILMAGAGLFGIKQLNNKAEEPEVQMAAVMQKEFRTQEGQRANLTLSDGTVVYLGPGSSLKYPERFNGSSREISMVGEAFFEVAHNPAKPFKIHSGELQTTVLGTSFKVNAFEGRPFEVKVATGKVRVDRLDANAIHHLAILTPGKEVKLNTADSAPVLGDLPVEEVLGWKASKLIFRDNTLKEIAFQLERAYAVHIHFNRSAKAAEIFTVSLKVNVPLNETLQLLGKGAQFKYTIEGKNITIK